MNDLAAAISQSLSRTGQGGMQADLNMSGFNVVSAGTFNGFNLSNFALKTGQTFTGNVVAPVLEVTGGNFYMNFNGANPRINFDTNDYLFYDRAADALVMLMGGNNRLVLQNAGNMEVEVPGSIRLRGSVVAYGTRSRIFINDGTSAPSGGNDGDLYFQYT